MSKIVLTNEGIVIDGKLMGKWEEIDHFEVGTKESSVPKSKGKEVLEAAVYIAAGYSKLSLLLYW
jgi:hypothetical protein